MSSQALDISVDEEKQIRLRRRRRFAARQKVELVSRVLRGETLESVSLETGVSESTLQRWQRAFTHGGQKALAHRDRVHHSSETRELRGRLTRLQMLCELLEEKCARLQSGRVINAGVVLKMAVRISPSTNRPYGIKLVAEAWGVARSSVYAARGRAQSPLPG